jgi:phosphate uptake regulator
MLGETIPESARRAGRPGAAPTVEVVRHLRRAGKGEVVVAVPRSWVTQSGLEIGSTLRLHEGGPGRLVIEDARAGSRAWTTEVTGRAREPLEHLFRCLVAGYLTGTSEIVLSFPEATSPEARKTVREFARRSGRMEVVSEGPSSATLRDISGSNPSEPLPLVVRMARAVLELQRRAGEYLTTAVSSEEDAYWETQDDEVDRLEWRVHRALAAHALQISAPTVSPMSSAGDLHLLAMARAFERIGDHAVRIGKASASLPGSVPQPPRFRPIAEFHKQTLDLLERVIPLVEQPDPQVANEIADVAESLHASHMALLQSILSRRSPSPLPPLTAAWLARVLDSMDRTVAYVADVAELALDRAALSWVHLGPPPTPPASPLAPLGRTSSLSSRKVGSKP